MKEHVYSIWSSCCRRDRVLNFLLVRKLYSDILTVSCYTTTEGSHTHTGKPSTPKGGLVSVLVDSVMEGIVVLLVNPLMPT